MKIISQQTRARAERFAKRFQKDEDGATAVEFALVAIPFFALLFGIIELAIVFFISASLTHSTSEAGRVIRVGNFQACGAEDEFKALVCSSMAGLGNCWKNVRIDVVDGASFKTITLPEPPPPQPLVEGESGDDAVPQTENGKVSTKANDAGTALVVRSILYYRLALPPALTRLETPGTPGIRVLSATTAFRNEPFPVSGSCDADTNEKITDGTPS